MQHHEVVHRALRGLPVPGAPPHRLPPPPPGLGVGRRGGVLDLDVVPLQGLLERALRRRVRDLGHCDHIARSPGTESLSSLECFNLKIGFRDSDTDLSGNLVTLAVIWSEKGS